MQSLQQAASRPVEDAAEEVTAGRAERQRRVPRFVFFFAFFWVGFLGRMFQQLMVSKDFRVGFGTLAVQSGFLRPQVRAPDATTDAADADAALPCWEVKGFVCSMRLRQHESSIGHLKVGKGPSLSCCGVFVVPNTVVFWIVRPCVGHYASCLPVFFQAQPVRPPRSSPGLPSKLLHRPVALLRRPKRAAVHQQLRHWGDAVA